MYEIQLQTTVKDLPKVVIKIYPSLLSKLHIWTTGKK